MTPVHKVSTIAALAVTLGAAALVASPANAQGHFHPGPYHHKLVRGQFRKATHLTEAAAAQANKGHFRKAATLHRRAVALRSAARHGY